MQFVSLMLNITKRFDFICIAIFSLLYQFLFKFWQKWQKSKYPRIVSTAWSNMITLPFVKKT